MQVLSSRVGRGTSCHVRWWSAVLVVACLAGAWPGALVAQQPQTARTQDEFVPVTNLPKQDQLPAAPLLVTAYIVVWLALLAYLWTIWRRLGKVDRELMALARRLDERGSQPKR